MPIHVMEPGDALAELAQTYGLFADTIWDDPRNALLRAVRERYDALAPGDVVHIPVRSEESESVSTDRRHRFIRKGIPAKIRVQLRTQGTPCAHQAYRLEVDGGVINGTTDANGVVEAFIPPSARSGMLQLDGAEKAILLHFASMEPSATLAGIRKRLHNLDIHAPAGNDLASPQWQLSLYRFQRRFGLPLTMQLDPATKTALLENHDRLGSGKQPA